MAGFSMWIKKEVKILLGYLVPITKQPYKMLTSIKIYNSFEVVSIGFFYGAKKGGGRMVK